MAEDQDKQKPKKTTLIKKKSESSGDGEKKRVRVVVKRKPKSKPRATEGSTPVVSSPEKEAHTEKPVVGAAGEEPQNSAPAEKKRTPAPPSGDAAQPTKKSAVKKSASPQEPSETARKERPAKSSDEGTKREAKAPEKPKPSSETSRSSSSSGLAWSVKNPGERRTPRRSAEEAQRSIMSSVGPRSGNRTAGRGRPGPRREGGRPTNGPGRPNTPGRGAPNRGGRPGGAPSARPGGPRPGGSRPPLGSRPGGPRRPGGPGAPPPSTPSANQKQGGKKFFKSKKGRSSYPRNDRQREKEIHYNRKKPQVRANPIPKEIDIMEVVTVSELARKMNLKANELIGKLMGMGMMVTINQQIDRETAEILAGEYGCKVNVVSLYDETLIETAEDREEDLQARSPIVTVMGHVDHGKTKLLDAIRSTDVVAGESGGITQHIGAYQVKLEQGTVTFLDTPGHAAFTLMRARGAQITDIVILVVAANDGVMPQTREAIDHAKEANVPIVVAINKVDLPEANVDRVKQQLSEVGLIPEEWGGQTAMVEISALKKLGINELLETVLVQAEVLELRANFDRNAEGKVIESRIDPGRGTVATILIERGTIKVGDPFVAGIYAGRVRAMFNDRGKRIEEATPSMPVEVLGFEGMPEAGDPFQVTDDEKHARQVGAKRQELKRVEVAKNVKKVTLANLYDSIQEGEIQELKVVIKGDVHGSVEALQSALEKLSTNEIRLVAIHASAGAINEGDVMLASASNALVIGFHVRPTPRALQAADREKVDIRKYSVIYDAVEDVRHAMEGMLAPDLQEETVGAVEVRETFKVPKIGIVAGCYVTEGKVIRNAHVRVYRDNVRIHEGTIASLKRFKDDAKEVETGYECGIGISNLQDVQIGDTLEIYVIKEVAKKLS